MRHKAADGFLGVVSLSLLCSSCGGDPPTPLMRAAFEGRTADVLQDLATHGAGKVCDALTWAARGGRPSTILAIAGRGVNPDTCRAGVNGWTPLMHAIHKDQVSAVDALIQAGSNVNVTAHAFTPLMMAAGNGNLAIVKLLLAAGADPRATTPNGTNVFTIAVMGGGLSDVERPLLGACHPDIVRELLARAPDLELSPGPPARVARAAARLNGCDEVLRILDR